VSSSQLITGIVSHGLPLLTWFPLVNGHLYLLPSGSITITTGRKMHPKRVESSAPRLLLSITSWPGTESHELSQVWLCFFTSIYKSSEESNAHSGSFRKTQLCFD
jgi:hypothetical protein